MSLDVFVITLREGLEAALIVGIILAYLKKTGRVDMNRYVYLGAVTAIGASILGAVGFQVLAGGFEGRSEELFEGLAMVLAAVILTTMIFWMWRTAKNIKSELEARVEATASGGGVYGLFALVFVVVVREGIETVLFLYAASLGSDAALGLAAGAAGLATAAVLGVLLYLGSVRIDIRKFFNVTSVLLILFAAGLLAHGVHEFQEAGALPGESDVAWDMNPSVNPDGTYPALHENGAVGGMLKALLGYNGNPTVLEVGVYVAYWVFILGIYALDRTGKMEPIAERIMAPVRAGLARAFSRPSGEGR